MIGFPCWFINGVRRLYFFNATYSIGEAQRFIYFVFAGVLQGCPLSASIFLVVFNPHIIRLVEALRGIGGTLRACADDVALVLRSLAGMEVVMRHFLDIEKLRR